MFFEVKKYISEKYIFDIMNFFKEQKVNFNFKTFRFCSIIKLKIHNNNYETRIYEYDDGYSKTINFVKIHGIFNKNNDDFNKDFNEDEICGVVIISKDENENNVASIYHQSTNNYTDCICIKCFENKTYKIGDILMKIIICICAHKNVKKIQLTDNSYFSCGMEKIPLIFLRTITHGKPFYTKYGFMPINHNKENKNTYRKNELLIYNNNYDKYKKNPTIKKKDFIQILNYKKFDKITDKKMINYINNIIIPSLQDKNISMRDFVSNLLKNKNKNKNKNNISCELLSNIILNIYYKCGYDKYDYKYFEQIFTENHIHSIQKHIKINENKK